MKPADYMRNETDEKANLITKREREREGNEENFIKNTGRNYLGAYECKSDLGRNGRAEQCVAFPNSSVNTVYALGPIKTSELNTLNTHLCACYMSGMQPKRRQRENEFVHAMIARYSVQSHSFKSE